MTPVRLEPAAQRSRVKHSTTALPIISLEKNFGLLFEWPSKTCFTVFETVFIAPDKDWKQLGIYPPLFGFIGYFKF